MVNITIDNKIYQVQAGKNLLETCQNLGLEVPYFCWHPELGSVGSCRQCAVTQYLPEDVERQRGKLVMSCMTPVVEGLIVELGSPQAKTFRALLIESTMTNHPHDCPVCEEGGECHLQDMTLMSGHINRRSTEPKRTYNNQYLGPFINHEMNRCIACYRCVRYYRDYAGGKDLNVFASRNNVYFGRARAGVLESEFSGNLVEVCPTGVFTDRTLSEHYTRKWDLQSSPSICTQCSVGCNTYPAEHKGQLRRISNRFHPDINGHFICDRGRFGYGYVNHADKLQLIKQRDVNEKVSPESALTQLTSLLQGASSHSSSIVAIGSARSSLENNLALLQVVGSDHFYVGIMDLELAQCQLLAHCYREGSLPASPVKAIEQADAALLIGEDVTQTAPVMALSLRQMSRNAGKAMAAEMGVHLWQDAAVRNVTQQQRSPFYIVHTHKTALHDIATEEITLAPDAQLQLINSVIAALPVRNETKTNTRAQVIASALRQAKKPVIVTGVNANDADVFAATVKLAQAVYAINPACEFVCALSQVNSMGVALLTESQHGVLHGVDSALRRLAVSPPQTLVILETDLYRYSAAGQLEQLLDRVKTIVVLEQLLTPTAQMADLLLPTTSFAEAHGTYVNYEGRAQLATACFAPTQDRRPAWQWLLGSENHDLIVSRLLASQGAFAELESLYPKNGSPFKIARKTVRATGRTATYATVNVREQPPATDAASPYAFSAEGAISVQMPKIIATDAGGSSNADGSYNADGSNNDSQAEWSSLPPAYLWAPQWNSNEALGHFQQEVDGPIIGSHLGVLLFKASSLNTANETAKGLPTLPVSVRNAAMPANALTILPWHNIFADDELSSYVPCIQKRNEALALRCNSKLAASKQWMNGEKLAVNVNGEQKQLHLLIDNSIPDGIALLPATLVTQLDLQQSGACVDICKLGEEVSRV